MSQPAERNFTVNGYTLAAKEWQADGRIKVLALHGWLDNAASFDTLAPLLKDCHVLALDLPGHGLSAHKSLQATYNIWDDLLDILAVADALEWSGFHLLGHSRGAIISMLLGATSADRVTSMLLLDGLWPMSVKLEDTASQLRSYIQQRRSLAEKKLPSYHSVDDAVRARCKSAGMSELAARPIVERGLRLDGDSYCWTSDARLTMASAFKLTAGHIDALIDAITIPSLLILAEQGMGGHQEVIEQLATYPTISYQLLPGSHHFHLESQAQAIANMAENFLAGVNQ